MTHYGAGYGKLYFNELTDEYNKKIGELEIVEPFNTTEEEVIKILEKSLENGKTFYENASKDIKRDMEKYEKELEEGILY